MSVPSHIRIFDTTLRDGEQSPGCSMQPAQKRVLARAIAELGADIIETGFPASSQADVEATQLIAGDLRDTTLCVLSRCLDRDIDASARALEKAAKPRLHVFVSTSPLHREHKLKMSREQVLELAVRGVTHARKYFSDIEFSPEDALRTEDDYLLEIIEATIAAGATTINLPDTVGYTTPDEIRALFKRVTTTARGAEGVIFSAHNHNDLGLAVANSLAAIEGGARQVECTINGIGERAGNAAVEELVMALKVRGAYYNADTRIDTRKLLATSRLLTRLTGQPVQRNKAIVGANAFAHESGIHQHGMLRHAGTYEIMRPQDVGWPDTQLVLGRHSGRAAVADRLRTLGYLLEDEEIDHVFASFKTLCEEQHVVNDHDLEALIEGGNAGGGFRIVSLSISDQGHRTVAQIELSDAQDKRTKTSAEGDGPVAALFAALAKATEVDFTLESYQVHSIGIGREARGVADIGVRYNDEEFVGQGCSRDVLEASAMAWLEVANRILRIRQQQPQRLAATA